MPAVYLSALLLSAFAFVISVFSFFFFRSYLRRRTGQERILAEFREEVNNILRSINETTDRDISLLEEREKNSKILLEEIDKRLKVYVRELEKRRDDEAVHADLRAKAQAPAPTYLELGKNRYRLGATAADVPAVAPVIAEPSAETLRAETKAGPEPEPRLAEAAPSAQLTEVEQIREMLRAGFSAPLIASRLGISITEVELATTFMGRREQ